MLGITQACPVNLTVRVTRRIQFSIQWYQPYSPDIPVSGAIQSAMKYQHHYILILRKI